MLIKNVATPSSHSVWDLGSAVSHSAGFIGFRVLTESFCKDTHSTWFTHTSSHILYRRCGLDPPHRSLGQALPYRTQVHHSPLLLTISLAELMPTKPHWWTYLYHSDNRQNVRRHPLTQPKQANRRHTETAHANLLPTINTKTSVLHTSAVKETSQTMLNILGNRDIIQVLDSGRLYSTIKYSIT